MDNVFKVIEAPGRVVRHLAEEFLNKNGPLLRNRLNYTHMDLLRLYDEMIKYKPEYHKMRSLSYTKFTSKARLASTVMKFSKPKIKELKINNLTRTREPNLRICNDSDLNVFIKNHHMKIFFEYFGGHKNITDYIQLASDCRLEFTAAYLSLHCDKQEWTHPRQREWIEKTAPLSLISL